MVLKRKAAEAVSLGLCSTTVWTAAEAVKTELTKATPLRRRDKESFIGLGDKGMCASGPKPQKREAKKNATAFWTRHDSGKISEDCGPRLCISCPIVYILCFLFRGTFFVDPEIIFPQYYPH